MVAAPRPFGNFFWHLPKVWKQDAANWRAIASLWIPCAESPSITYTQFPASNIQTLPGVRLSGAFELGSVS